MQPKVSSGETLQKHSAHGLSWKQFVTDGEKLITCNLNCKWTKSSWMYQVETDARGGYAICLMI